MLDDAEDIQIDFFLSTFNRVGTVNDVPTDGKAEVTTNGTCITTQVDLMLQ